jgi:hypothetical protein
MCIYTHICIYIYIHIWKTYLHSHTHTCSTACPSPTLQAHDIYAAYSTQPYKDVVKTWSEKMAADTMINLAGASDIWWRNWREMGYNFGLPDELRHKYADSVTTWRGVYVRMYVYSIWAGMVWFMYVDSVSLWRDVLHVCMHTCSIFCIFVVVERCFACILMQTPWRPGEVCMYVRMYVCV